MADTLLPDDVVEGLEISKFLSFFIQVLNQKSLRFFSVGIQFRHQL